MADLNGQVAVVVGSSSGMGKAAASKFPHGILNLEK